MLGGSELAVFQRRRRHRLGRRPGRRPVLPGERRRLQGARPARGAVRHPRDAPDAPSPSRSRPTRPATAPRRRSTCTCTPRKFAEKKLAVTDAFLQRKVPELLARERPGRRRQPRRRVPPHQSRSAPHDRGAHPRSLQQRRRRRRCGRSTTERCCACPARPLSGFADRRTYTHDGTVIDHQTHLGYDIASLKNAAVPAAAAGRVVFVGPLGIYGNAVIIDHGLGLFTLYGHLSEIVVDAGRRGRARRHRRQDGRHRARRRRPPALQHHGRTASTSIRPTGGIGTGSATTSSGRLAEHPARRRHRRPRRPPDAGVDRREPRGATRPWRRCGGSGSTSMPPAPPALPERPLEPLLDGPDAAALVEALGEVGGDGGRPGAGAARGAAARARAAQGAAARALPARRSAASRCRPSRSGAAVASPVGGPDLEGLVSAFDGRGDRLIWLLRPQAGGGTLLARRRGERAGRACATCASPR